MTDSEARLRENANGGYVNNYSVESVRWAIDEIDRLRAALAVFADKENWECYPLNGLRFEWTNRTQDPIDFARRALEGKP